MSAPLDAASDDLTRIESELKANLARPRPDTADFLDAIQRRLRLIPMSVDVPRRIECLLLVAQQIFHHGQSAFPAVEPAAVAVMLARSTGDTALVRRALTFQGIILSATNNAADSLRSHVEALEIAEALDEPATVALVWNNIGTALYNAALYSDARASYRHASGIASDAPDPLAARATGLQNEALCLLHVKQYEQGIQTIRDAIGLMPVPITPAQMLNRVFAEGTYTRLLLAQGRLKEAAERVTVAKSFAAHAKSIRADISVAVSEGLVEVYSGLADQGLSRAMAALEKARAVKVALRDTLLALVEAHERAGRPDRALALHRELTLHIRKAQQDSIVKHHQLHLKRLELHAGAQYPEGLLTGRDDELQRELAEQFVGSRQGELLEQMAYTAELREDSAGGHCFRVGKLAALMAERLGEDAAFCEMLELAARLHDLGKVGIPDSVLQKQSPLTDGERLILQTHTATGGELLGHSNLPYTPMAVDIARHHHERWDGHGYPDGIAGNAIPLPARIVALADAYDSMVHPKPYRTPMTPDDALGEIDRGKGMHFDPALTEIFGELVHDLLEEYGGQLKLDAFLGAAAESSAVSAARRRIAASLERPHNGNGNGNGSGHSGGPG